MKKEDGAKLSLSMELSESGSGYLVCLTHDLGVSAIPTLTVRRIMPLPVAEKSVSRPKMAHGATLTAEDLCDPAVKLSGYLYGAGLGTREDHIAVRQDLVPVLMRLAENLVGSENTLPVSP